MPWYATVCHGMPREDKSTVGIILLLVAYRVGAPVAYRGAPVAYRGRYAHGVFKVQIYRGHPSFTMQNLKKIA